MGSVSSSMSPTTPLPHWGRVVGVLL
ncbi:hypothetical protein PMIN01_08464 [Paraphaeosphaeria minitans]|uniref:Uncharacterized protein n=1 Tax=Paraphaeosphaeria minitans TaxID=565426 RepID=A0A9P6GED4_9PLEO|nr:hypothetical protein PMIN01_08464 [Paraphaeosphaeria minitans]